jgi:hypothetical protein
MAQTISPEKEPEYVGAHSALADERCQNWQDAAPDVERFSPTQCDRDATHTVVMADENGIREVAMCDECGEPEDVDYHEREWTGEVRE